ncbi:polysaccharide deacetylase family protein [Scopulibacillus cellulosilyticus]|uniref:Polysaccharide deacetylase family protein n=1 Tax=Scopulibacillus cellulosilyticus TaxID=2665665 RepID=A0ABW2Q0W4_9BACL
MSINRLIILLLIIMIALSGCSNVESNNSLENESAKNVERKSPVKEMKEDIEGPSKQNKSIVDTSGWFKVRGPVHIPILMYHSISTGNNSLYVPKDQFREQMTWLKDNGYYTLSPEEAYDVLTQGKKPRKKIILVTFDDGYLDNFTNAYPILRKYGMKATIFMIGRSIDKQNHLTKQQMKEMSQHGISIESHTINHLQLSQLPAEQQRNEMVQSKALYNKMLNQNTILLCYPFGSYNNETLKLAKETGYKMAVTTEPGAASRDQGLYALHRIRISPGMSIQGFGRIVDNANQ